MVCCGNKNQVKKPTQVPPKKQQLQESKNQLVKQADEPALKAAVANLPPPSEANSEPDQPPQPTAPDTDSGIPTSFHDELEPLRTSSAVREPTEATPEPESHMKVEEASTAAQLEAEEVVIPPCPVYVPIEEEKPKPRRLSIASNGTDRRGSVNSNLSGRRGSASSAQNALRTAQQLAFKQDAQRAQLDYQRSLSVRAGGYTCSSLDDSSSSQDSEEIKAQVIDYLPASERSSSTSSSRSSIKAEKMETETEGKTDDVVEDAVPQKAANFMESESEESSLLSSTTSSVSSDTRSGELPVLEHGPANRMITMDADDDAKTRMCQCGSGLKGIPLFGRLF